MDKPHCSICTRFAWNAQAGVVALCTAYPDDPAIAKKYKPLELGRVVDYYVDKPAWCDKFAQPAWREAHA